MGRAERLLPVDIDIREYLLGLPPRWRVAAVEAFGPEDRHIYDAVWEEWAHHGQLAPPPVPGGAPWATWVIKAGRGFGKTRAGAEWLTARIAEGAEKGTGALALALVGATLDDARRVMVEGESGLLAVAADWIIEWRPSLGRLRFRTGAAAQLFSGHTPHLLRGPQHHYAWCDELAKWEKPQETWDMLQLGLRAGTHPQAVVTTTPNSGPVLRAIMDEPDTVVTGGPTRANPHLPRSWQRRMHRLYAGTRLGRQELDGEVLPQAGALWTPELIEKRRLSLSSEGERGSLHFPFRLREGSGMGQFTRTLIAVDPPTGDGTCGIVAVAREGQGDTAVAHILADHSVTARSPEGWSSAVAAAAAAHGTIEVVAERNQGGEMVKAVLRAADPRLRIKLVHAHHGKAARAEPVAHLFEAGRAWLHGHMPELEAQLLGMIAGGDYEGPGDSPDRADAMVWGVGELMAARAEVRVRVV